VGHNVGFSFIPLDISDFPTRHNYLLALRQNRIERIMADWVADLPVKFYRGCEVTGFAQDNTGVDVELSDGRSLRAKYLAGCDGGRSLIRKNAGIDFPGWEASTSYLIAEAEMADEPPWGVRRGENGVNARRCKTSVMRSSPFTARTSVFVTRFGYPDLPTWLGRRPPTETDASSWLATRRTRIPRRADRDSTSVSRMP